MENLYKLIMNSIYGKTIESPHEKDYKNIEKYEELDKFWIKNHNKIVEDIELSNSTIHAVIYYVRKWYPYFLRGNFLNE